MRIQRLMPASNGVAAGQTATFDLPCGLRYHQLAIEYSGTTFTLTHMTEMRVVANGEVIHRYSATERDTLNQFDKRQAAAGILFIPFDRNGLYQQTGEERTALQTGKIDPQTGVGVTSLKLEIDIAGTAVAPSLKVTATQSPNDPNVPGAGVVMRVLKYARTLGSTGDNEISDFPKGTEGPKYQFVNRAHFKSANTTKLSVIRDNFTVFERSAALNSRQQQDGQVRTPQAGWVTFDPTEWGFDWESLALYQAPVGNAAPRPFSDVRYRLNLSGSETITAIVEYLGAL